MDPELGLNESAIHTDFMVGSPEVSVSGESREGARHIILREGDWVCPRRSEPSPSASAPGPLPELTHPGAAGAGRSHAAPSRRRQRQPDLAEHRE